MPVDRNLDLPDKSSSFGRAPHLLEPSMANDLLKSWLILPACLATVIDQLD
jgi:hypothetical protein